MNQITKYLLLWTLLGATLLSGCSLTPPAELHPQDVAHPSETSAWELKGKLAVKTPDDNFSTNLYWLHTASDDKLVLTSMLGTTVLTLTSTPSGATLEMGGKRYHDNNPQQLLKRITGWSMPLNKLPLWITGQLSQGDTILTQDKLLRPKKVQSQTFPPWLVTYQSWHTQSGSQVPRLLSIKHEGIRLKIQTNQWQALTDEAAVTH